MHRSQSLGNVFPTSRPNRKLTRGIVVFVAVILVFNFLFHLIGGRSTRIQHRFPKKSFLQLDRQNSVKKEFLHAWTGYKDHGWMADGLMPLSGGQKTQFCSWSATLVDSLDTLWIMGLTEEFEEAVNATMTIDFRHNAKSCTVNLFESTIRYLGGMLAAYDLSQDPRLLTKAAEVGDMLLSAFNTTNGMPCNACHLASKGDNEVFTPASEVALADLASLSLEFTRLSQITKNDEYLKKIDFLTGVFAWTQNASSLPGLWPEMIDPSSIETNFSRKSFVYSLGAMSDSSYEYLLKGHMLVGSLTNTYAKMWEKAAQQIRKFMLFRAFIPDANETDILFSGIASRPFEAEEVMLEPRTQHLACFAGGMFAMASRVFGEPYDFEIGKQLTNGCIWAYQHSPSGIMPETVTLLPCHDAGVYQCPWDSTDWAILTGRQENCLAGECVGQLPEGYYSVMDATYKLRPEAIESIFIMWRMTGDEYWREAGWEMFQNIIRQTRTAYGHAALFSVMAEYPTQRYKHGVLVDVDQAMQTDDMESFWFAETLKYFYLLFSEPDLIDLDEWVLNTEAHPLRLTKGARGF